MIRYCIQHDVHSLVVKSMDLTTPRPGFDSPLPQALGDWWGIPSVFLAQKWFLWKADTFDLKPLATGGV